MRELTKSEYFRMLNMQTAEMLAEDRKPKFIRTQYDHSIKKHVPIFAPPANRLTPTSARKSASASILTSYRIVSKLSEQEINTRNTLVVEREKQIDFYSKLRRAGD